MFMQAKVFVSKTEHEVKEHWGYTYENIKHLPGKKFLRICTLDKNMIPIAFTEIEIENNNYLEACRMLGGVSC